MQLLDYDLIENKTNTDNLNFYGFHQVQYILHIMAGMEYLHKNAEKYPELLNDKENPLYKALVAASQDVRSDANACSAKADEFKNKVLCPNCNSVNPEICPHKFMHPGILTDSANKHALYPCLYDMESKVR